MPLRDHFRPPLSKRKSWEGFHGGWPMNIAKQLNRLLPAEFEAEPRVHLGSAFEIDVSTYNYEDSAAWSPAGGADRGAVATAAWAPPAPTVLLEGELPIPSEYEVLVYNAELGRRLVAAIEVVSPSNKDRPENRAVFVSKCQSLLYQGVNVVIVDVVTVRSTNLFRALAEEIGAEEPAIGGPIYAAGIRLLRRNDHRRVEAWPYELTLGQPLPTLPLWLSETLYVSLDLESSYEETCRDLRIP